QVCEIRHDRARLARRSQRLGRRQGWRSQPRLARRIAVTFASLPDWLDRAMPELVRDYLDPLPAARARHFGEVLARCAAEGEVVSIRRTGTVDAVAGVEPLDWDSRHFGLGCARLAPLCLAPGLDASARLAAVAEIADWAIGWCRKKNIKMLLRRMVG